ncbi:MAG: DUF2250 domain-containing protein [Nanoarchaeota archaeon]|nr:DUF2250 domain-containing protein [Nanoarchaeota archaeon]
MGLELLVDDKVLRILRELLQEKDYTYAHKIAREAKIPVATAFRILQKMAKLGIIEAKKIGNIKLYKVLDNSITRKIRRQL